MSGDAKVSIDALVNACRERDAMRERAITAEQERDRLRREVKALRDSVAQWAEREPGLDPIVVSLNLIVDGVPT